MPVKKIKYLLCILLIFLVAYYSVYIKKLDAVKQAASAAGFNTGSYARTFYDTRLLPHLGDAVEINSLMALLKTDLARAFKNYSHALDIGNIRYFLVRGEGTIAAIGEDAFSIALTDTAEKNKISIAAEFIYGNAIRDASGLLSLNAFSSTSDLNRIAEEMNKIVRTEVVPPFKAKAIKGDKIKFAGAMELNQAHVNTDAIEILPIQLSVLK